MLLGDSLTIPHAVLGDCFDLSDHSSTPDFLDYM
jgi:hypothetical protein